MRVTQKAGLLALGFGTWWSRYCYRASHVGLPGNANHRHKNLLNSPLLEVYCATLAAATTVVLASKTGLPVSTTHIAVGAVMGVGLTRGIGALDLRIIRDIVVSWVITLPAGGFMAMLFFFALKGMFGISCPACAP